MAPKSKIEVVMTKEQIDKLLHHYEEEEDLWNVSLDTYHKKEARTNALLRIKEAMDNQFEVDQIAEKLKNLRSYYCRELAKVNKTKRSGAGSDEVYKSNWPYYETLDSFLRAQIIPRKSVTNLNDSTIIEDEVDDDDSQCSEDSRSATPKPPSKKKKLSGPDLIISEAVSVLSDIKNKSKEAKDLPQNVEIETEDTLYCKYLAKELQKITDDRTKALVKMKFQNILFEAHYGQGPTFYPQQPNLAPSTQWRPQLSGQYNAYMPQVPQMSQAPPMTQGNMATCSSDDAHSSQTYKDL